MGEIVAAAVVSHVPSVMAPEAARKAISGGKDTTLAAGFADLRAALDTTRAEVLIIFDTHWFTTVEHVFAGAPHFRGEYTSEELPSLIRDHAYDFPGAPALAERMAEVGKERSVRLANATSPNLPLHYPTLNLLHYLRKDERVLSIGVCQTAEAHNFIGLGEVLAEAISRSDARVALLAAGGMSHRFWPMDSLLEHGGWDPANLRTPEARAMDERILELWREGDHASVLDLYPEYRGFAPEGFFGHYLMMVGALGAGACRAQGRQLSDYENAVGTGQVHVWFDLPGRRDS